MKRLLILAALVLAPASAHAQTPLNYLIRYYNVGAAQPIQEDSFAASTATCNQAPPTGTSNINPTRIAWTDPNNAGRVCTYTLPSNGNLLSLPIGANYEGTLRASNQLGAGPESARADFSRLGLPAAPAGLSFIR